MMCVVLSSTLLNRFFVSAFENTFDIALVHLILHETNTHDWQEFFKGVNRFMFCSRIRK
jgi:hypothetical protein